MTKTDIMGHLLIAVCPGQHDRALDDQPYYGPRGGLLGYEHPAGAYRPGNAMVSRAVHAYAKQIRHGVSIYFEPGRRGHRSSSTPNGVTLPDTPLVHAVIAYGLRPEIASVVQSGHPKQAASAALELYRAADLEKHPDTLSYCP